MMKKVLHKHFFVFSMKRMNFFLSPADGGWVWYGEWMCVSNKENQNETLFVVWALSWDILMEKWLTFFNNIIQIIKNFRVVGKYFHIFSKAAFCCSFYISFLSPSDSAYLEYAICLCNNEYALSSALSLNSLTLMLVCSLSHKIDFATHHKSTSYQIGLSYFSTASGC